VAIAGKARAALIPCTSSVDPQSRDALSDLLLGREASPGGSANVSDGLLDAVRRPLVSLSHRAPSQGYDEPQNLSYAISSICPAGADGGQSKKLSVAALDSHMKKCIADAVGKK
jgi:hypothetical protein